MKDIILWPWRWLVQEYRCWRYWRRTREAREYAIRKWSGK